MLQWYSQRLINTLKVWTKNKKSITPLIGALGFSKSTSLIKTQINHHTKSLLFVIVWFHWKNRLYGSCMDVWRFHQTLLLLMSRTHENIGKWSHSFGQERSSSSTYQLSSYFVPRQSWIQNWNCLNYPHSHQDVTAFLFRGETKTATNRNTYSRKSQAN